MEIPVGNSSEHSEGFSKTDIPIPERGIPIIKKKKKRKIWHAGVKGKISKIKISTKKGLGKRKKNNREKIIERMKFQRHVYARILKY